MVGEAKTYNAVVLDNFCALKTPLKYFKHIISDQFLVGIKFLKYVEAIEFLERNSIKVCFNFSRFDYN